MSLRNLLKVLILVLMEDTLRDYGKEECYRKFDVLILVLMEDTLRVLLVLLQALCLQVLILVLMEDTLRAVSKYLNVKLEES